MQAKINNGKSWKVILVTIVGLFLVGTTASLIIAGKKVSRVVDKDYYSHGLHYGEDLKKSQIDAMDWHMTSTVSGNMIAVSVQDSAGRPVSGGNLTLMPGIVSDSGIKGSIVFGESKPGTYQAFKPDSNGQVRGILNFNRGNAAITGNVVIIN